MSGTPLRVACPVCGALVRVPGGRFAPHDRPSRPGERFRTTWCEGRDREAAPEAILAGVNALVDAAAGNLRAACLNLELADAAAKRAHALFQARRTWATRYAARVAGGAR